MAADVEGVERLLEELHRVKDEDFPDSEINDPAALVEQLSKAVLAVDVNSAGNEADISLFSSFMFSSRSPRDMLSFVTATINRDPKGTKKARMAALSAVADFIKHVKDTPNLDRYAVTIKQGVWEVFAKETLSHEVRSRALKPLRQLLKLRPPSLAASKWEVTDMWITIQEQYRLGSSKSSQGVRGELLKLAGVLLLVYGEHVPDLALGVDTVLSWCDFTLNEHASNKKRNKKLEPQVVAGSLACIDLVCAAGFEARYSDGVGENTKNTALYTHLLKAAADGTAEGLTRYEVAAKALRFFRRHAILFADNVGPLHRALQLYEIMEKCASAGSSSGSRLKLKKHALPGIEAIIGVVSHYAAHSGNRSVQKETVLKFEGMWLGLVEGGDPTKEETTVALAGLAAISPAATALCSYQEAIDVADRLLVCLDSALGRLDSLGILDNDGDSEEEDSADGVTAATGSSNNSYAKRDRSIRLKAQYLRTLACRAGVLGGIAAKKHREGAEMDVEEGTHSRAGVRVETSSPGVAGAGIPGHLLRRLATLATHLVEKYAMLVHQDRALACRGLCQLWVSLSGPGQGDNLSHALAAVVPKGVVRAAAMEDTKSGGVSRGDSGEFGGEDESSKPPHGIRWIAPVDPVTGEADTRLCFLYADMWRRLLDPGEDDLENFVVAGATGGLGVRGYGRTVAPEVYDAMLSSILSVVKRLDLRYETSDEGGRPHPLQPTDQQLFLNLVSFCQELLPRCRPDLLLEWAPLLCPELVERSLERPLVSGFYRLITLVFREASRTGYFDPPPPPCNEVATPDIKIELATPGSVVEAIGKGVDGSGERSRDDDRNVCVDAEEGGTEQGRVGGADGRDGGRSICRRVLCRYLEWMTVRLSGFRDELLAACIEALLSAPIGLLDGDLRPLVPALKLALASGSSHLPTAIAAITALERWNEDRSTVLRPHLGEVLPHLDRYLSSEASTASESGSTEKARRSKGKKKTSAAAAAIAATGDHGEESQRKDLRRRVVRFLGRLGGR